MSCLSCVICPCPLSFERIFHSLRYCYLCLFFSLRRPSDDAMRKMRRRWPCTLDSIHSLFHRRRRLSFFLSSSPKLSSFSLSFCVCLKGKGFPFPKSILNARRATTNHTACRDNFLSIRGEILRNSVDLRLPNKLLLDLCAPWGINFPD